MALRIQTFSNTAGGDCFFKAAGHPFVAQAAAALVRELEGAGPIAVYDPLGHAEGFDALHSLRQVSCAGVFVQSVADIGRRILGRPAQPVTDLKASAARALFVVAFDAERAIRHVLHLVPEGCRIVDLDRIRLPDWMVTNSQRYLDPLNFATNFALFRDADGQHTRLATMNYWAGYGAKDATLWLRLIGADGETLAEWSESLPPNGSSIVIDSRAVRARFDLRSFAGQLFLHVVGGRGHDVVKYALDLYGDDESVLSATHDANAWPADRYAGLPAPAPGERVTLWVQNSHPAPIPPGGVGLNLMGSSEVRWLDREIGPFATFALDVATLVPEARWPQQLEVQAGRYFVRPRYEVRGPGGRARLAHVNVERTDLKADPRIPELGNLMGKGYILPAPVMPVGRYRSSVLPTPMATCQDELPLALVVYDSLGREAARHRFGRLPRGHARALEVDRLLEGNGSLAGGYGHMELIYDFSDGGAADGWLHGIFRYEDRRTGHAAETSFGAHIFNTALTYNGEPQSYSGPAPGLSTRLFLRLGPEPFETVCHLIYPVSSAWRPLSDTQIVLHDARGGEVAHKSLAIPMSGSVLWRYSEMFEPRARARAGDGAYVLVRDSTCRLFGYHGLERGVAAFSLDHMFGF
ncbi:MAG: hypothetical protein ACREGL_08615 [Alphaproteobacteria bacterium]